MSNQEKFWKFGLFFVIFFTSFLFWSIFTFLYIGSQEVEGNNTWSKKFFTNYSKYSFDISKFWEVHSFVKKNYYAVDGVKEEDIVDGMIRWYMEALWDKHSEFMNVSEKKQFDEMLAGDFEWIGAIVWKHELWVIVERLISSSPAKKSDVRAGDIIVKVDGLSIEWFNVYDAVAKIKWQAGTQVKLTILRMWEKDVLEKTLQRDKIKIPSVDSKVFTGSQVGYIALNIFWDETSRDFRKAITQMKEEKTKGIIIDLRDNWWGYLQSAVQILSELLKNGAPLVETRFRNSSLNKYYPSINDGDIYTWKIVVLVNENSASASEITAGALRENDRAILVWKKTYGKWSVQEPFDLSSGDLLKLTIAQWYTPKGHMIDKKWIEPDIEVDFKEEDYKNQYDRQLEEAKEVLKEYIKTGALQLTIDKFTKK